MCENIKLPLIVKSMIGFDGQAILRNKFRKKKLVKTYENKLHRRVEKDDSMKCNRLVLTQNRLNRSHGILNKIWFSFLMNQIIIRMHVFELRKAVDLHEVQAFASPLVHVAQEEWQAEYQ